MYDEDKALIRSVEQGRAVSARMQGANACHLQNHGMVFTGPQRRDRHDRRHRDRAPRRDDVARQAHRHPGGDVVARPRATARPPLPRPRSPKHGSTTGSGSTPTPSRSGRGRRISRGAPNLDSRVRGNPSWPTGLAMWNIHYTQPRARSAAIAGSSKSMNWITPPRGVPSILPDFIPTIRKGVINRFAK